MVRLLLIASSPVNLINEQRGTGYVPYGLSHRQISMSGKEAHSLNRLLSPAEPAPDDLRNVQDWLEAEHHLCLSTEDLPASEGR